MTINNKVVRALIALEIKNDSLIITKAELIKKAIRSFDGKVFNARFEKALAVQTALPFNVRKREYTGTFELSVLVAVRSIQTETHTVYLSYSQIYLGNFFNKNFVDENNRINADVIIKEFENWIEETRKNNQEKLTQLEHLETLQKEREEIEKTIKEYNSKINYNIDEYAKLKISVRARY